MLQFQVKNSTLGDSGGHTPGLGCPEDGGTQHFGGRLPGLGNSWRLSIVGGGLHLAGNLEAQVGPEEGGEAGGHSAPVQTSG